MTTYQWIAAVIISAWIGFALGGAYGDKLMKWLDS